MVFLFLFLAACLFVLCAKSTGSIRIALAFCCLLNVAAAGKAIYTGDQYAYKLMPPEKTKIL
ncbi:hypothetical protein SAMN05216255_1563 [Pseudomonas segetis]|uniref:Uncharacterized protein n=1 Tax=Pseudomonas segetis TaxID=298908 RepID=A0A239C7Y4_9PSED|nr:hypothetical protein SAMN05216255_1563 [Pseudomonas segetis]